MTAALAVAVAELQRANIRTARAIYAEGHRRFELPLVVVALDELLAVAAQRGLDVERRGQWAYLALSTCDVGAVVDS